ncbi:DinB family protein [Fimbriimonas ginsengisoli]|uniref:DinB-like domain-containing protein n=1 Tax=Fimbriimonas ginsengisoli Gsoil 348 TaxID=661478 RepID=A0A068NS14_FIMGI|nr:DinB family protein [Fimbriimonas ginsengisoli]AIE86122.1 hypothetical protein OP10G_2754 [Fimbriimonas ginsengisoli Gsoil 348]
MDTAVTSSPIVEQAKQYTVICKDRLLKTLSFIPDDKLDWAPAPTCKSALRIAAHCGVSNGNFLAIIAGAKFPEISREEMIAMAMEAEKAVTTREQAIALIEQSSQAVLDALDSLTPEQIEMVIETPFITAPMPFWMNLPGRHMDNHASQIDYLQTCWGDMVWHL